MAGATCQGLFLRVFAVRIGIDQSRDAAFPRRWFFAQLCWPTPNRFFGVAKRCWVPTVQLFHWLELAPLVKVSRGFRQPRRWSRRTRSWRSTRRSTSGVRRCRRWRMSRTMRARRRGRGPRTLALQALASLLGSRQAQAHTPPRVLQRSCISASTAPPLCLFGLHPDGSPAGCM